MTTAANSDELVGEKALEGETLQRQVDASVVQVDPFRRTPAFGDRGSTLWLMAAAADSFSPWGTAPTARDAQLRAFLPTESFTISALSTMVARNMALRWVLDGPEEAVAKAHSMLLSANQGAGFQDFIGRLSWDLYCADKGAFFELIGKDRPEDECIGVQHLDSLRCHLTGDPMTPVIYQDFKARWHYLKWFQVVHLVEMPSPIERVSGLQFCALTRILAMAQKWKSLQGIVAEKAGGRYTKRVSVVTGVDTQEINDAINKAQAEATERGQRYYMNPVVIGTLDPGRTASVADVDLAALPDGFSFDEEFKQVITLFAMGLLGDYQDLAPLPGGNLGTSAQSQVLHMKSRGKGPGLFMQLIEQIMNNRGIIDQAVTWRFDEQDVEADKAQADLGSIRASARATMIASGEIDPIAARRLAVDAGDIPPELADELDAREEQRQADERARQAESIARLQAGQVDGSGGGKPTGRASDVPMPGEGANVAQKDLDSDLAELEKEAEDAAQRVLTRMRREMRAALAEA